MASTWHIQSSWVHIKQPFMYSLVFSIHISIIILAPLSPILRPKHFMDSCSTQKAPSHACHSPSRTL
uniref:Uncharacterized protein n=1 Tax=Arundo donax TaxID=35708 RepID=A0A0A9BBP2_ARUDO